MMNWDARATKSRSRRELSQFVAIARDCRKLLIFRAINLRDQEVGGSNPLAPTI
jgi:hypothetical protein